MTTTEEALEEARKLLAQWEAFARTLVEADAIALPERLHGKTVGFLDSTAC